MAATLGQRNPFRYRGYYFDPETGLYYLKTRYYDPETCRFISADLYLSTGQGVLGYNSFAYCLNDPVGRADEAGLISFENAEGMRDVTEEVYAALDEECKIAPVIKTFASSDIVFFALIYPPVYVYFASIMYHNRKWDIKRGQPWQNTIKTTYPGNNTVLFNNEPATPENLGNITYGYIGAAYGIPLHILLVGSFAVATKNSMNDVIHEFKDHKDIRYGYFLYYKDQITGRRNRA